MHLLFTLFLSILVLDWKNDRDGARIGRVAECHFTFAFHSFFFFAFVDPG